MFLIDTCSWLKLDKLDESGWEDIIKILFQKFKVSTTHDIVEEFNYHLPNKKKWLKEVTITPKNHKLFKEYVGNIFDPADASLLSLTNNKEYTIVTEDPAMLVENIFARNNIIQLIDLIFIFYKKNLIKKDEFQKILLFFRKKRNITKEKTKSFVYCY